MPSRRRRPGADRLQRYPPLLAMFIAIAIATLVLPSSLNVPLANPGQTLEFAPVPADGDQPPTPTGNLGELGLGSSRPPEPGAPVGNGGGAVPAPPPPPAPEGIGDRPTTKRCVGDPPRQTEDPMSPPCVAHFDGDNFGATYRGVSQEEVTLLVYVDPVSTNVGTSRGSESDPFGRYFDLATDPAPDEPVQVRNLRVFQRYFNDRYQTYGRFVHLWVYYGQPDQSSVGVPAFTPESRRADAADNLARVRPFAVLTSAFLYGYEDDYIDAVARSGALVFGTKAGQPAEFFQRYAGLVWSYQPALEKQIELYTSYVCRAVVGQPVVAGGGPSEPGSPRRVGLIRNGADNQERQQVAGVHVREQVEACGGDVVDEIVLSRSGRVNRGPVPAEATTNMARFQSQGITTILWAQGYDNDHSRAAADLGYRPEWVVAGDGDHESAAAGYFQDQDVWERAVVVTSLPRVPPVDEQPCIRAMEEAAPGYPRADSTAWACGLATFYQDLRQLFTGIQVAGPKLTPSSIEQGFRAIPAVRSADPLVPACFYERLDYSCVKDATTMWWDAEGDHEGPGPNGASTPGCWRLTARGERYLADGWPEGNVGATRTERDPCNNYNRALPNVFS